MEFSTLLRKVTCSLGKSPAFFFTNFGALKDSLWRLVHYIELCIINNSTCQNDLSLPGAQLVSNRDLFVSRLVDNLYIFILSDSFMHIVHDQQISLRYILIIF